MKFSLIFCLILNTAMASAELVFIDRSGPSLWVRDQQRGALVITGEAAQMIAKEVNQSTRDSQITCGDGYCVLGEMNRQGEFASLDGKFYSPDYFSKLLARMKKPTYLAEEDRFKKFTTLAFAYPTQCQEKNLKPRDTLTITVEGMAAQQIYNFITNFEQNSDRFGAKEKSDAKKYFACEKMPQYDQADIDHETGAILEGSPISYVDYRCKFEVDRKGLLLRNKDCHIYGGAISAGGGN